MKRLDFRTPVAIAISLVVICMTATGTSAATPVQSSSAEVKTALLAGLDADLSTASGWVRQVGGMGYLGSQRTAIAGDVGVAYSALAQLRRRTTGDSSAAALSNDSAQFTRLDAILATLEGPKIALAALANLGRADFHQHFGYVRTMDAAGGTDPLSPIYAQTVAIESALQAVKFNLDQGVALLDVSAIGRYPGSLATLANARNAINRGMSALAVADQLRAQDLLIAGSIVHRYLAREQVISQIKGLFQLRLRVFQDRNLSAEERTNILGQINADLAALNELDKYVVESQDARNMAAELSKLANEPGVFLLIAPKADIMLAAADDRAAIRALNGLIHTLSARIAAAAARHKDVTHLNALKSDLIAQLAGASADIAPIDAEFEPMTAITSTQLSHDAIVIHGARIAISDANARLTTATSDAQQILDGTP
jgi:hypothetical protein